MSCPRTPTSIRRPEIRVMRLWIVAAHDPGMTNWLSTAGHPRGLLWFRWFLAESMPDRPTTEVITLPA